MRERINWTDERIASEIMKIADQFNPPRMPSHSEMHDFSGDYRLSNAITKRGGSKLWANKLGLEWGDHETATGVSGEQHIADILKSMGYEVETTSARFPYDLLVDKCVKIDVKSANTSYTKGCPVHAFRLAKRQPTCDLYIFYEVDADSIYIVPAHRLHNQVQVEMGLESRMYAPWKNAFYLISELVNAFNGLQTLMKTW